MNKLALILLIGIASVFTIVSSRVVPGKYFEPYNLELDSLWNKEAGDQEYIIDLNNDSVPEHLLHHKINQPGSDIEIVYNNVLQVFTRLERPTVISPYFHFSDVDQDGTKEIILLTTTKNVVYLGILGFDFKDRRPYLVAKVKVDTFLYSQNVPDIKNYDIVTNQSEIYFDLNAGYSIQPRNIYKYDCRTKVLEKTGRNSIVSTKLQHININGESFLLAKEVLAPENTYSPERLKVLEKGKGNKDTLKLYQRVKQKDLLYKYGDFSSYMLLYDNNLDFAFEPIEFRGGSNYTKSEAMVADSTFSIVAITNTQRNKEARLVTICNQLGKIEKQIPLPHNFTDVFTGNGNIVFFGDKTLFEYSKDLEPVKQIKGISYAGGFYDIGHDKEKEFIAFEDNGMAVFTGDLKHKTTFKIEQEFAPFPEGNRIEPIQMKGKSCFLFNSRLFYYLFSYSKNRYAFLKYPFYLLLFAFWWGLLFLLVKLNSKRLEKENQRLEEIVTERTLEINEKNEKLSRQNKHLEELGKFKKILTSTLVHDLKNPLGQILSTSKDKTVNGLAGRMLLLVTNMLDVDKYEHAEFVINRETHPLKDIIADAVDGLEISLREKNIRVLVNMDDLSVWTDKEVLIRVFENLLSNAIRFSPQNMDIEIGAHFAENGTVKISIKNYGDNIPGDALESIFDKYSQVHKNGSTAPSNYKTTGLGLTFCKMAVQAHGHAIKAENFRGGAIFSFYLNGQAISSATLQNTIAHNAIVLSEAEKDMLKPWFRRLKAFDIYQVSDILETLNQIPDSSENIIKAKQQIIDAIFSSNTRLFSQLID